MSIKKLIKSNKILYILFKPFYRFYIDIILLKIVGTIFRIFPINNKKIIVCSYYGNDYSDNPKYIVEELIKKFNKRLIIKWALKKELMNSNKLPVEIKPVKYESIEYLFDLVTSKVWIDNSRKSFVPSKRKKQFYIQTWHAGLGLKKGEKLAEKTLPKLYCDRAKKDSLNANLFISNSKWETKLYHDAFWYSGEVIELGLPRNDILINKNNHKKIVNDFKRKLNIEPDTKIVLYAPTFRVNNDIQCYNMNFNQIINTLEEKTNDKWVLLIRLHPNIENMNLNIKYNEKIINMSHYHDLNDIMIASDILITDYSSLMFDFSYMNKPIFLYTTDLDDYSKDRGFLFDLSELPFYLCLNEKELIESIRCFNKKIYIKNLNAFFEKVGLNETGKASYEVARRIMEVCGINEKKE